MTTMRPLCGYVTLACLLLGPAVTRANPSANPSARPSGDPPRFALKPKDVVVFTGGTNMLRIQQAGYLEALLTHRFAAARPKFRDLSWEADTVYRQGTIIERWRRNGHFGLEAFGDLSQQLQRVGATVIVAQFGQLESFGGKRRLPEFVKAYDRLLEIFQRHARLVVLLTPTPFETPPTTDIPDRSKHGDLEIYVKAICQLAQRRGVILVDLSKYCKLRLTDNGLHYRPQAHPHLAHEIGRQLLEPAPTKTALEPLRKAVIEKHRLWYDYWRPANWKLLYGDDARRQFTRGPVRFRDEWKQLLPKIMVAEQRVWTIAAGGKDPGDQRPPPENLHGDATADIEKERAAFMAADGFQVNLFASEKDGLTSPLNLRWDPAGRMYVTVTTTYPHARPGELPNDKIIRLEDTDDDGRADKSVVFADGLNIPTGIEWGEGGVYVGQNTQLLFLKDTDGDGVADQRRVLLSGFGNGDSHQTINSFVWSPDGQLYFGHGDGCESRVETPWGASHLFNAGYFRLRPKRLQLISFLEGHMGPGNPWGVAFDAWGQIFGVDGAGGVSWLSPAQVSTTHRRKLPRVGAPGGYCGIGYVDGRNVPKSMRGDFVIGDFKSNRVKRFRVKDNGAGFALEWRKPLLQSRHRNFRPVDVKVGPDGAIYVVDWYNPITCHQDDAYRDPRRDKAHGRIWRVSQTASRPLVAPDLTRVPLATVLDSLRAPEYWTRYQAKRALTDRDPVAVTRALDAWVAALDPKQPQYEYHLLQALGAHATIESVAPSLLRRLLQASDPRARAFATRIVGRWSDRLEDPLSLLAERVLDPHPRVRMEAVVACSQIPAERSIQVAATVVDRPMDSWIEYAFRQTVHRLQPHWLPALKRGRLAFKKPQQLAAVLNEAGGREVLTSLKRLVDAGGLERQTRVAAHAAILAVGGPDDLRHYGLDRDRFTDSKRYDSALHADVLARLLEIAEARRVSKPDKVANALRPLTENADPRLRGTALRLVGLWRVAALQDRVRAAAEDAKLAVPVRAAALTAISQMRLKEGRELLLGYARQGPPPLRAAATRALVPLDMPAAAEVCAALLDEGRLPAADAAALLQAFLDQDKGAATLASALSSRPLEPAAARRTLKVFFATGRSDRVLFEAINGSLGAAAQPPPFTAKLVQKLATAAAKKGVARRGAVLYKSLACASCHKTSGVGGDVGPDLTALGTTLSSDRIVEELLWPNRQVKEGYAVVRVITTDGKVLQGRERPDQGADKTGDLILEDLLSRRAIRIKRQQIAQKRNAGSLMPTGLTAVLSQEQLLDLIQYLSELGKLR